MKKIKMVGPKSFKAKPIFSSKHYLKRLKEIINNPTSDFYIYDILVRVCWCQAKLKQCQEMKK